MSGRYSPVNSTHVRYVRKKVAVSPKKSAVKTFSRVILQNEVVLEWQNRYERKQKRKEELFTAVQVKSFESTPFDTVHRRHSCEEKENSHDECSQKTENHRGQHVLFAVNPKCVVNMINLAGMEQEQGQNNQSLEVVDIVDSSVISHSKMIMHFR